MSAGSFAFEDVSDRPSAGVNRSSRSPILPIRLSHELHKENKLIPESGFERLVRYLQHTSSTLFVAALLFNAPPCSGFAQSEVSSLTPTQVDQLVDHLDAALDNYVFPDIAAKLKAEVQSHRGEYRGISNPTMLAARLTADMRAVGHDQHLAVIFDEQLAIKKDLTPEEEQHAHAFDLASGFGVRSARRLPGNVGYVDLSYFSPDRDAGSVLAAVMQLVNGTDALILDLRRNGGGSGETETTLLSYFVKDTTQLSSVVETVDGKIHERQHWTSPYVQGPRYTGKPLFILTSHHTHSAAEVLAYDLQNCHLATIVGEPTSGDATSATGTIDLGHHFSAFIANGQIRSPITNRNYIGTGVQPDVPTAPAAALLTAYNLALKGATSNAGSDELMKERASAMKDPLDALLQEVNGFPQ